MSDKKEVATVELYLKHNDLATIILLDDDGNNIQEKNGYIPYVGNIGGDDTHLIIENETGKIIGWKPILSLKTDDEDEEGYDEE